MAMETEDEFAAREGPQRSGEYWAGWQAYIAALTQSGVLTGAAGSTPPRRRRRCDCATGSASWTTAPTPIRRNSSAATS